MKPYLKSALAIFLIITSVDLYAQIKSGYIIGLNMSTMTLKTSGKTYKPVKLTGIHLGRIFEIPLKGNFTLQSGLVLSAKGSIYKIDSAEFSLSPVYIEVPVYAVYSIGTDVIKISLFAGPYFACGIGGNKESGGELKKISFGTSEKSDMKLADIGLNFGAGVKIKSILISAQYGLGLVNLSSVTKGDSEMKNKVIGISVRSFFAGK